MPPSEQGIRKYPQGPPVPHEPHVLPVSTSRRSTTLLNPLYPDAVRQLEKATSRAHRRGNIPFHPSFARSQVDGRKPPLAQLIQGGQGGEVRLKLYLCITMMATAEPHDIRQPPHPTPGPACSTCRPIPGHGA